MSESKEMILGIMRAQGRADALDLRARAADLDGTAVIEEEVKAPAWDGSKDYSGWPVGAPVTDAGQVYKLLQPHNASHYPGTTPATLPALWSICHTKDPAKAKPYLAPNGQSGMYMTGECCTEGGHVYQSTMDNNVWAPSGYPSGWSDLGTVEEIQGTA